MIKLKKDITKILRIVGLLFIVITMITKMIVNLPWVYGIGIGIGFGLQLIGLLITNKRNKKAKELIG